MLTLSSHLGGVLKWTAGAVYIMAGIGLIVLGLPLAALPFHWEGLARWVPWILIALPVWLGIASVPGCFTALVLVGGKKLERPGWIRLSLWGVILASTAGIAGGSLMALFIPLGLIVMIGSVVLLYIFEDVRGRERPFMLRWLAKIVGIVVAVFAITLWALQAGPQG
jgi:hypothetical protein